MLRLRSTYSLQMRKLLSLEVPSFYNLHIFGIQGAMIAAYFSEKPTAAGTPVAAASALREGRILPT